MGIRGRLLALTLGFAIPIAATGLVGLELLWTESRDQLHASVRKQSELAAAAFERWIESERQPLVALAASASGRPDDSRPDSESLTESEMRSIVRAHPNWLGIEAHDANGKLVTSYPTGTAAVPADLADALRRELAAGARSAIETNWLDAGKDPVLLIAARLDDGGDLTARVDAASMGDVVRDIDLPDGSVITLFDPKHRIIQRYPNGQEFVGRDFSDSRGFALLESARSAVREATSRNDGVLRVYGLARVGGTGCTVGLGIPSETLYGPARAQFDHYLIFCLVALGCATAAAVVFARKISRPVMHLSEAAHALGEGDFTVRSQEVDDGGELAELSRVFNRMATSLEEREAKLAELDRLKNDFVSSVSHELRTPLTTIKTLTQVMRRGGETAEERARYLDAIAAECDRQIDFVLDLLDLSRIEAGGFSLYAECVDVAEVAESYVATERFTAEAAGLDLVADMPEDLPYARADRAAVRRVLRCLVENAVKYTPSGGRVTVSAHDADGAVVLTVADTGQGILPEDVPHVFEKFFRSAAHAEERDGVGLGLYLARSVVGHLGGEISVESEVDRGSVFAVTLPRWTAEVGANTTVEVSGEEASANRR